jgi:hypothetical protein
VPDDAPPFFIWHTVEDEAVPLRTACCSLLLSVPTTFHFELHLFQEGGHGLSMCNEEVNTPHPADVAWVGLCDTWLERRFDYSR